MARGNGRGDKSNRGAGRGRGNGGRGRSAWSERGRGRGQFGPNFLQQDFVQTSSNAPVTSHVAGSAPGKRGRGRGGPDTPGQRWNNTNLGTNIPGRARGRGRAGYVSPRGRGRGWAFEGIGSFSGGPIRPNTTLSNHLYQERPLLRPIIFVPSAHTRVLFQNDDDELLKPVMEDVDDTAESHLPTADRISRVFSAGNMPVINSDNEGDEEGMEVVDFNNIGTLFDTTGNTSKSITTAHNRHWADSSEVLRFTGAHTKKVRTTSMDAKDYANVVSTTLKEAQDIQPKGPDKANTDKLDSQPTFVPAEMEFSTIQPPTILNDDDDVIVYVAPNPRISSTLSRDIQDQPAQLASSTADTPLDKSHSLHTASPSTILSGLVSDPSSSTIPQAVEPINLPSTPVTTMTPTTSIPEPPSFSSITFSFSKSSLDPNSTATAPSDHGSSITARLRVPPVMTPRQARLWKQKVHRVNKRRKGAKTYRAASFGAFGAMREEALLHRIDKERDERYNDRRKGDSDLEWGDTDNDGDDDEQKVISEEFEHDMARDFSSLEKGKGKEEQRDEGHGMDVDPDLDMNTMTSFVQGLLGPDAGKHVTMDDVRDQEMMKMEDEEQSRSSGSEDEEVDRVIEAKEARLMDEMDNYDMGLESTDDDEEEDDDIDEPSFDARLQSIRAKAGAAKNGDGLFVWHSEDEDEDDELERYMTCAGEDDDFIEHIQDMLDENEDALTGKDRQQRKKLFDSINDYDKMEGSSHARRRNDRYKDIPQDLRAQWEKDRLKKADRRKARELERLATAADPLKKKKGGKKGRKAMLSAASSDPSIVVLPNRVIDMTTLVQQIKRFVEDIGGPSSMSLPPTNKETRKNIHEMAMAFGLKSVSKGKGDTRYTTLIKKTTTGISVDEAKVRRILKRSGGAGARGDSFYPGGRNGRVTMPKQKEGDEVGKAAPKLDESNVGFRLLSNMGWSEGDRIGASMKGLVAPLLAIFKTSKLGLGAKKGAS